MTIDSSARADLYRQFQELAIKELPIINLVNFSFISVANKSVQNVANNPRWATTSWYDTWLAGRRGAFFRRPLAAVLALALFSFRHPGESRVGGTLPPLDPSPA